MKSKGSRSLKILRQLAIFEGISYILLLGICMPLKYVFDIPETTYPVGLAHGVLFVAYGLYLLIVTRALKWSFKTFLLAGIASLLPFGTFVADRKIFAQYAQNAD